MALFQKKQRHHHRHHRHSHSSIPHTSDFHYVQLKEHSEENCEKPDGDTDNGGAQLAMAKQDHHHHHHRHHHHRKKKAFQLFPSQKKYHKHKQAVSSKVIVRYAAVCVMVLVMAAGLWMALRLYNHVGERQADKKQTEAATMKEDAHLIEAEIQGKFDDVRSTVETYLPGIVCWGGSLTAGGSGTSFPETLEQAVNESIHVFDAKAIAQRNGVQIAAGHYDSMAPVEVVNMGAGSENAATTLGRCGAVPFVLAEDVKVPSGQEPVEMKLLSRSGEEVAPLRQTHAGMDYVVIGGIQGTLTNQRETEGEEKADHYLFTRNEEGDDVMLSAGTEVITSGSLEHLAYIPVVFLTQKDDADTMIRQQRAVIDHQQVNEAIRDRFIVIGYPFVSDERWDEVETAMQNTYGLQYLNLREYMSTQGLSDAGLTATEKDREMMLKGEIPDSLLADESHFNATGYELIGKLVCQRMRMLGYFDEVNCAIDAAMESK